MACTPEACLYHVWQKVKLNPRDAELTEICLACGVKLSDWNAILEVKELEPKLSGLSDMITP